MKLIYSIPDKLYYIQNFLDYSTYKGIHHSIFKERKKINLHTSKGLWSEELINNVVPPKRVSVDNYPPFKKLEIYKWNNQFGGELMFNAENGHGYIPVVGNSLIIIKSPLQHKVNPVLSPIVPRVSVQMFLK